MKTTQVTVEKLDDINIRLTGTIDNRVIETKIDALKVEAKKADKKVNDETLERAAQGQALQEFINNGMKKANVKLEDTLGQPHFKKYEKQTKSIYLEVDISTHPIINTNTSYIDIVPTFKKPTADLKTVEAQLTLLAKQQAPFTTVVTPRAVQNGDFVDIDFEGFLNNKALASANEKHYKLKIGSQSFLPGFEAQMIGLKVNEEKVINVTFPTTYKAKELAGKETNFNVKLHEIREQIPLKIDDELAKKVLKDSQATLEVLKKKMADQLIAQTFSNTYNTTIKPKLIQGLLHKFNFTLPNNVIEQEIDARVNDKAQQMSKEDQALYKEDDSKFDALRDSLRQAAKDSIKAALIVDALAKKEGLDVSETEIIDSLKYQAQRQGQDPEKFVDYYEENNLLTSVRVGLIEDKLFSKILGLNQ